MELPPNTSRSPGSEQYEGMTTLVTSTAETTSSLPSEVGEPQPTTSVSGNEGLPENTVLTTPQSTDELRPITRTPEKP